MHKPPWALTFDRGSQTIRTHLGNETLPRMKQYRRALPKSQLPAAAPVRLDTGGTPDSFSERDSSATLMLKLTFIESSGDC